MTVTSELHAQQKERRHRKEKRIIQWGLRQRPRTGSRCFSTAAPRSWPRAGLADVLSAQGSGLRAVTRARQTKGSLIKARIRQKLPLALIGHDDDKFLLQESLQVETMRSRSVNLRRAEPLKFSSKYSASMV